MEKNIFLQKNRIPPTKKNIIHIVYYKYQQATWKYEYRPEIRRTHSWRPENIFVKC